MLVTDNQEHAHKFPKSPRDTTPPLRIMGFTDGKPITEDHLTSPEAVVLVLAHPADAAVSPLPSVAALLLFVL